MKFNYQTHANKPGIYKITNTHTSRIYIGQAQKLKNRWNDHKRHLLYGTHSNKFLQNDFNKCREELRHDDFLEFDVLEVMEGSTKEQRCAREEVLIQKVWDQCVNCYNIKKEVASKDRTCYSRTPEETSKIISENSKKYWSDPEWKAAQLEKMKLNAQKEEYRAKLSVSSKLMWSSEEFKASQKEKLKAAAANRPAEIEQRRIERSAATRRATLEKIKLYGVLIAPDGTEHEVWNVRRFASEHGLESNRRQLLRVLNGTRDTCKGWRNKTPRIPRAAAPLKKYIYTIQSPDGSIHCITFLKQFIKDNPQLGLKYTGLHGLVNGNIDHYKGWKRYPQL